MSRLTENFKRLEEMGKLNRYHMGIIEDSLKEYEKEVRVKAIDEFAEALRMKCIEDTYNDVHLSQIFKIAEQLKGGAE